MFVDLLDRLLERHPIRNLTMTGKRQDLDPLPRGNLLAGNEEQAASARFNKGQRVLLCRRDEMPRANVRPPAGALTEGAKRS